MRYPLKLIRYNKVTVPAILLRIHQAKLPFQHGGFDGALFLYRMYGGAIVGRRARICTLAVDYSNRFRSGRLSVNYELLLYVT